MAEMGTQQGQKETVSKVKGSYSEKKSEMAMKTKEHAMSAMSDKKDQAAEGLDSVAQALRHTAEELLGQQQAGIARYADRAAEKIDEAKRYLEEKDMDRIIEDAEHMIQRQPALFLGGAFVAGFLLARFVKSAPTVHDATQKWTGMPSESEGEAAG